MHRLTALIIATSDRCTVILVDSLMACYVVGSAFTSFARVFCIPAGVSA